MPASLGAAVSNPARSKGTRGENFFLLKLRDLWYPGLEVPEELHPLQRRSVQGALDYGDFSGTPMLVEAKNTTKPSFMRWARIAETKTARNDGRWIVVWKGDLRRGRGHGPYVLMPFDQFAEYERVK